MTRRELLGLGLVAGSVLGRFGGEWRELFSSDLREGAGEAEDEAFWGEVRGRFLPGVDDFLYMNAVGLAGPSLGVLERLAEETRRGWVWPTQRMWRDQRSERKGVRERLAGFLGCEAGELAMTGNATQGLHIGILGVELGEGQGIASTSQDYSRAWNAMEQRRDREGVRLVRVEVAAEPGDEGEYLAAWERALGEGVGLAVVCTTTYLNGHVVPLEGVRRMCRERGVRLLVDAAQSVGLRAYDFRAGGEEMATMCFHKWLMGPIPSGAFLVRRDFLGEVWPLNPCSLGFRGRVEKFEQQGTTSYAHELALHAALAFHEWLGMGRLSARLWYLRRILAERLQELAGGRARFFSSTDRGLSDGMLTVGFSGVGTMEMVRALQSEQGVHTTGVMDGGVAGVRFSPSLLNSVSDVERVAEGVGEILRKR